MAHSTPNSPDPSGLLEDGQVTAQGCLPTPHVALMEGLVGSVPMSASEFCFEGHHGPEEHELFHATEEGDTQMLTGAATFQRIIVDDGKELLLSGEDLTSAFYLFRLPEVWAPYMVLGCPVEKRALGIDQPGSTHVGLNVFPMGWHSAVGLMQAAHREIALRSRSFGRSWSGALGGDQQDSGLP